MNIISDKEYQEFALCAKEQAKVQTVPIQDKVA